MIDTDKLWDDVKEELDQKRQRGDDVDDMRSTYINAIVRLIEEQEEVGDIQNWIRGTICFMPELSDCKISALIQEARVISKAAIEERKAKSTRAAQQGLNALDRMKDKGHEDKEVEEKNARTTQVPNETNLRQAIKNKVFSAIEQYKDVLHQFDEKTIAGFMLSELSLEHRKEMLEENEYIRFVRICLQECEVQCEETHGELPGVWKKELGTATLTEEEARIMRYFADHALLDNKKTSGKVRLEEILYITGASMNDGVDGKDWTPNCITSLVDKLPACFEFEIHKEWNTSLRRQRQTVRWIKLKYTPQNI